MSNVLIKIVHLYTAVLRCRGSVVDLTWAFFFFFFFVWESSCTMCATYFCAFLFVCFLVGLITMAWIEMQCFWREKKNVEMLSWFLYFCDQLLLLTPPVFILSDLFPSSSHSIAHSCIATLMYSNGLDISVCFSCIVHLGVEMFCSGSF